jgi:hypothetical protein
MPAVDNNKPKSSFTLHEVANWQLQTDIDVGLPKLQRGFVWKPHQVEDLWDSLFRDFPVGTFILAETDKKHLSGGNSYFELLDGQQRATAITFGFLNPWDESLGNSLWKVDKTNYPILWLDLVRANTKDESRSREYIFRLITRSHPWGYQRAKNQNPLESNDRKRFLDEFKKYPRAGAILTRCSDEPLRYFWPWDAKLPVPFAFLRQATETEDWKGRLKVLCREYFPNLTTKYLTKGKDFSEELDKFLETNSRAGEIYKRMQGLAKRSLPGLPVPRETLQRTSPGNSRAADEDSDEIETLFVRINSAGTPLAGEELIYSIYKSIFPGTIKIVEGTKPAFLQPSRLISIAIRVVLAEFERDRAPKRSRKNTDPGHPALPSKVRVKDFRRRIYKNEFRFKTRLLTFINSLEACNVFENAYSVLVGNHDFQLPVALAADLARHAPDIFFILVYRLYRGDNIELGSAEHVRILGILTGLAWFGRGDQLRDHDACLRQIWEPLLKFEQSKFWRRDVFAKTITPQTNGKLVMLPLIPPRVMARFLNDSVVKSGKPWEEVANFDRKSQRQSCQNLCRWYKRNYRSEGDDADTFGREAWKAFIEKLWSARPLLLFAQRHALKRWFPDFAKFDVQNFEDTNCPWDWDHIYPQNAIKHKQNVDQALKDFHNSIGNLRVWPFELNRADSDKSPSTKLLDPAVEAKSEFAMFGIETRDDILKMSFISDTDFCGIDNSIDIKSKAGAQKLRFLLIGRIVELYDHWYRALRLEEVFPQRIG